MNSLVAQMMGRKAVREDVPVPVGVPPSRPRRDRAVQRRTAAAMIGLREADDESIIPDDAEEIQNIAGPSGVRVNNELVKKDQEPEEPDAPAEPEGEDRLLTPRDALVAPDVTPQALEPIDPSEVPQPKTPPAEIQQGQVPKFVPSQPSSVNPMDVLLGRTSNRPSKPEPQPEQVMTAEHAQATVNTLLNVGGVSGEALLQQGAPMPAPKPGDASKIMEAFSKYGPAQTRQF